METQQRRHVETDAFAVAIIVDPQRILSRDKRIGHDRRRRLFISADVVAEGVALARHSQVERADVAQETIQILRRDRFAKQNGRRARSRKYLRTGWWRRKIL